MWRERLSMSRYTYIACDDLNVRTGFLKAFRINYVLGKFKTTIQLVRTALNGGMYKPLHTVSIKKINICSYAFAFHCTSRMLIIPHLLHFLCIFPISEFYCVNFWVNAAEARQFRTISSVYSGTWGDIWGNHKILRPWGEDIAVQTSARRLHMLQLLLTERLRPPLFARHILPTTVFADVTPYSHKHLPTFRGKLLPASSVYTDADLFQTIRRHIPQINFSSFASCDVSTVRNSLYECVWTVYSDAEKDRSA